MKATRSTYSLRNHHPRIIKAIKLHLKYPKLIALIIIIFVAYYFFTYPLFEGIVKRIANLGYISIFLSGTLYTYGFTMPFAVGILATSNPPNIILASLIAGFGALISDLVIFKTVRITLMDEFKQLKKTKLLTTVNRLIKKNINAKIKLYLLYVLAGFAIASPLPDEIGVIILAGLSNIKSGIFGIISFLLNTAGILVILLIS